MMQRTIWAAGLFLIGTTALLATGCGSSASAPSQDEAESIRLSELGELYRTYVLTKKAPPKTLNNLQEYEAGYPLAMTDLRAGALQVYWGANLVNPEAVMPGESPSDEVLAFETRVPEGGGYVMLSNREIKKMTPEEFQAAPKAGKVASSDGKAKAAS